jgi:hypothetical protein
VARGVGYCLAAHVLVVASHTPPALSQSAFVLAAVTSAAKADAANATPRANAKAYVMLLMGSLPFTNTTGENSAVPTLFQMDNFAQPMEAPG